ARADAAEFKEKLHKQQLATARQVQATIQVPDDRIRFEQHNLVGSHVKAVGDISRVHPEQNKEDQYILEREAAAKEGKKDRAKVAEHRERYDYLKEQFQVLQAGYEARLTKYAAGMRFDIVDIKPVLIEGKKVLRMDIFVWGPPEGQMTFGDLEIQFVRQIEVEQRGRKKMTQALAKITGAGPPFIFHENAHEWIYEWPPGVAVGYYQGLPLLAPDASKMTWTMRFTIRSQAGTSVPVELKWENIDVDSSWRAPEGSPDWANVEVAEASEDELKAAGIAGN
ncbi:MAG: hypothetical protein ACO3JL_17925, partial [Myxococcota bacterium]